MQSDHPSSDDSSSRFTSALLFIWRYLRAFALIWAFLWLGNHVSTWLPITIPGSIVGLLLLFFGLSFQLIQPKWVQPGCSLFMKYMTLLFIPAAMGIMKYYPLLFAHFAQIIISCVVSSAIVLIFVGKLTQTLHAKNEEETE